jgi:hypothetical protein
VRHNFKKHKYNAKPTEVDGIRFDSQKEARYYVDLKLRQRAGEVLGWFRQVPIHLPGGTVLRIDFLEFHTNGSVHIVDVKGMETKEFKIKKREAEAAYPWLKIETV